MAIAQQLSPGFVDLIECSDEGQEDLTCQFLALPLFPQVDTNHGNQDLRGARLIATSPTVGELSQQSAAEQFLPSDNDRLEQNMQIALGDDDACVFELEADSQS